MKIFKLFYIVGGILFIASTVGIANDLYPLCKFNENSTYTERKYKFYLTTNSSIFEEKGKEVSAWTFENNEIWINMRTIIFQYPFDYTDSYGTDNTTTLKILEFGGYKSRNSILRSCEHEICHNEQTLGYEEEERYCRSVDTKTIHVECSMLMDDLIKNKVC